MRTRLLTNQAAAVLGCTPANVRALARAGKLPAVRVGHVRLFDEGVVRDFAAKRRQRPARTAIKPAPSSTTAAP